MRADSIYSMHPGFAMEAASERNILERTGKSIDDWVEILRREGPEDERAQKEWLKSEHGFTTNYASWVVGRAAGTAGAASYDPDANVEKLFSGKKATLRPIFDKLVEIGSGLGSDVKVCPCATIVPFFRTHVFAQAKPAGNSRLDIGFCLRGVTPRGRLEATGGEEKGDRITHRIALSSVEEVDGEVLQWFRRAYEADA